MTTANETTQPADEGRLEPTVRPLVDKLRDCAQGVDLGADGMGWSPNPALLREAADEIESLRAALKWYADGEHFTKADPDAWDTVSGEPQNWWCDEAGTAMVEDGSLAGMVLAGKLTGTQLGALEDGEEA
ncbi:MAG: hypothetical protein E6Q97_36125 [Desulfurellales bacterium]|nr:MAG: hypothetical protein E6Q97_36125 [Desulfurellales bacterium]